MLLWLRYIYMFSTFLPDIISAFKRVDVLTHKFCAHVLVDLQLLPAWCDDKKGGFEHDRNTIVFAFKNFGFDITLKPQETYQLPGVVAGTVETLECIEQINTAKDDFKKLVGVLRQATNQDVSRIVRSALYYAGFPGISLKQVMRHIPSINYHPRRFSWTKGKCHSGVTLNQQDAAKELLKIGAGQHIDIQIKKLSKLKPGEKLVKCRESKPYWMVNIAGFEEKNKRSMWTSLPIVYLHDAEKPLPMVCFSKKINRVAPVRSDKKIESIPYLSSIHAFRYRDKE